MQNEARIPEFSVGMLIVPQIGILTQILEITFYIIIYKELSSHDKTMFNSSVITKDIYVKRKKRNLFGFASQVLFFIAEGFFTLQIVFVNAMSQKLSSKEYIVMMRIPQFAFLTILKIGCSHEIRKSYTEKLIRMWSKISTMYCK